VRTTVVLDDDLVREAARLTGVEKTSALLAVSLKSLIALEAGRRLAVLGGSGPDLVAPPRRREW
jgi:Arc/MetJ family transcription regulator